MTGKSSCPVGAEVLDTKNTVSCYRLLFCDPIFHLCRTLAKVALFGRYPYPRISSFLDTQYLKFPLSIPSFPPLPIVSLKKKLKEKIAGFCPVLRLSLPVPPPKTFIFSFFYLGDNNKSCGKYDKIFLKAALGPIASIHVKLSPFWSFLSNMSRHSFFLST
jgi:hypothetical protein